MRREEKRNQARTARRWDGAREAKGKRPKGKRPKGKRPRAEGRGPTADGKGQGPRAEGQVQTAKGQNANGQGPRAKGQRPTANGQRPRTREAGIGRGACACTHVAILVELLHELRNHSTHGVAVTLMPPECRSNLATQPVPELLLDLSTRRQGRQRRNHLQRGSRRLQPCCQRLELGARP